MDTILKKNRMIKLKSGTTDKSIVFIHDGCGEVIQYLEICKGISEKYSVYGMRYGIENLNYSAEVHEIEKMAEYYLKLLELEGIKNIYAILGFCIGGKIAFEMCKQLNQEVEHLILLNAIPPNQSRKENDFDFDMEYSFIKKRCLFFYYRNKKEKNTEDNLPQKDVPYSVTPESVDSNDSRGLAEKYRASVESNYERSHDRASATITSFTSEYYTSVINRNINVKVKIFFAAKVDKITF